MLETADAKVSASKVGQKVRPLVSANYLLWPAGGCLRQAHLDAMLCASRRCRLMHFFDPRLPGWLQDTTALSPEVLLGLAGWQTPKTF